MIIVGKLFVNKCKATKNEAPVIFDICSCHESLGNLIWPSVHQHMDTEKRMALAEHEEKS